VLVVAGCSGSQHSDAVSPTKPAASARLPDGPPMATPGEHMAYRLALQGMELATYDFSVGEVTDVAGKKAIVVQSHAKAVGLVKMVANIDDYFTSWVDVSTGRPLRWTTDEFATKGSDKERTDARFYERTGDSIPIDFHLNDEPAKPEPQKVSMPDVWDYNAFLVALRAWEGAPGTSVSAEVLRSRFMWHVDMKIRGKEKIANAITGGEVEALRLDGHTYKLDRTGAKAADSDERDFSIWISDDGDRVPLQTVARTDYGDIKMEITDYSPGTGQRLRN
jgi:uncharacterized protein DUF3108